jgi:hypothetical protein
MPPNQETPVNTFKKMALAAGLCAAGLAAQPAQAQSTDGYHTIQVIPVAVDTGSFAQRFNFRNPNSTGILVGITYLPGTGTSQATPISCTTQAVAAHADKAVVGLRTLCPALVAAGSQFGFLYMVEASSTNLPFAAFSRVANPQGNGFTVEAFPAHTFTSADSTVIGVRRAAATLFTPAYQTNCFVANDYTLSTQNDIATIYVRVYNSAGTQIGSTTQIDMLPGKMTRMLDVFNYVGAPAGDYDNARVTFEEAGTGEPGIISFCTTQESTTFGADFRIAKQEDGGLEANLFAGVGSHDIISSRDNSPSADILMNNGVAAISRPFTIPAGGSLANTHVIYFRNPDYISCEIINPTTGVRALTGYGLEMRMLDSDGVTAVAGGDDSTGWGLTFLGDKQQRGQGGNNRYTIEVEANGFNTLARPYRLHCQSGSGHTGADIVRYQDPDRF